MDFVELDEMVIARETDGLVWSVVEQIVGEPDADAGQMNVPGMCPLAARDVVDVIVDCLMPARREGLAVAPADLQARRAGVEDVAGDYAVLRAPFHHNAIEARVANATGEEAVVPPALDFNSIPRAGLDSEAAQRDMRCVAQRNHRLGQGGQHHARTAQGRRRPEKQPARFAVNEVFARLIQFFEQVHREEPARLGVATSQSVAMLLRQRDAVLVGVNVLNLDRFVPPVEAPITL